MLGFYKERNFIPSNASTRVSSFEFEYTDNFGEYKSPDYIKSASILIKVEDDKTILTVDQEVKDVIDLILPATVANRMIIESTAIKTIEASIKDVLIPITPADMIEPYSMVKDNCFQHLKIHYKIAFYNCEFNPMKKYHYTQYKSDSTAEDFQAVYDKIISMYYIILQQKEPLNIRERLIDETIQLLSKLDDDKLYITLALFEPFRELAKLAENVKDIDEEKEKAIVEEINDVMKNNPLLEKLFLVQDLLTEIVIRMKLSMEDLIEAAIKVSIY